MSSEEEYTTDEGKRKKNSEKITELFAKSAKTRRTPERREAKTKERKMKIK